MDFRVLRYFLTVAREGNMTRAAAVLHITQPTLSRQISQLEDELHTKLFRRTDHGIVLTDEGALFRRRAQELIALADRAREELAPESGELSGKVAIGCAELRSMDELASIMASFRAGHPLVRFEVRSGSNDDIKAWLEQGAVDLGLLLEPVDMRSYDFVRTTTRERWGVLVRDDSPLASRTAIRSSDLVDIPLITTNDDLVRTELASWSGKDAKRRRQAVTYNLRTNAVAAVHHGIGTMICLDLDANHDGLRFIPLDPPVELASVLVWKDGQPFAPSSRAFIDHLRNAYDV